MKKIEIFSSDPLVAALQRLVNEKGRIPVAETIDVNEQTIYQIVYCIRDKKTGKPKGVGPKVRAGLDKHYPGWHLMPGSSHEAKESGIPELAASLAKKLAQLDKNKRPGVDTYIRKALDDCKDSDAVAESISMIQAIIESKPKPLLGNGAGA